MKKVAAVTVALFAFLALGGVSWLGNVLLLANIATASLPTCNATYKGGIVLDSTTNTFKFCDGSAWTASVTSSTGIFSSVVTLAAIANNTDFGAATVTNAATLRALKFTTQVAGTDGGGTTAVVSLCNAPGACTTSFGSVTVNCTTTAGTVTSGTVTTAAIPAATVVNWRITTNGCTTAPLGLGAATYTNP